MENAPRKASDIVSECLSKINQLLAIIQAQDLNIKVLSNKLNDVMQLLEKQAASPQKITVEAVSAMPPQSVFQKSMPFDPERQVPISAHDTLPVDNSPNGFRRTSRPETFEGDHAYLPQSFSQVHPKYPVQVPNQPPPGREQPPAEIIVPSQEKPAAPKKEKVATAPVQNAIPVMQRIVDRSGKSIFLADVEIVDHNTAEAVFKTRTNGTGKWMASLGPGKYRVTIRKGASMSKDKMEAVQDIQIDGSQSPLELQTMICK